jgi:hypothetical protein
LTAQELVDILCAAQSALHGTGDLELSAFLSSLDDSPCLDWVRERLTSPPSHEGYDPVEVLEKSLPVLATKNQGVLGSEALKQEILAARRAGDDARAVELTKRMDELRRSAQARERRER